MGCLHCSKRRRLCQRPEYRAAVLGKKAAESHETALKKGLRVIDFRGVLWYIIQGRVFSLISFVKEVGRVKKARIRLAALLAVCLLLCGCDSGIWLGSVRTTYGLSRPSDELPESIEAPDEVRMLFGNFVTEYARLGNLVSEFTRPGRIGAGQLIMTALFMRRDALSDCLIGEEYYISAERMHETLLTVYSEDDFEALYYSDCYDPEYDRFVIPAADVPEPVSAVCVLTDCRASDGTAFLKTDVYSLILVDPLQAEYRYVLDRTVGYLFEETEDGYRLHATAAYFKSTGVEL